MLRTCQLLPARCSNYQKKPSEDNNDLKLRIKNDDKVIPSSETICLVGTIEVPDRAEMAQGVAASGGIQCVDY
jgi:hypothetical protein